jgi:hypothetical protein
VPADTQHLTETAPGTSSKLDTTIDIAIAAGVTMLILIGFATSYRTLRDLATEIGGYPPWLAPAVPLSFDLGIVVLSLKVLRLAREGRPAPVLRLQVAALSIATVAANASAASTPLARLLHVVPPAMFVICFESIVITARRHALERLGRQPAPTPRIRAARWLLAPGSTWQSWRTMVLASETPPAQAPTANAPIKHPAVKHPPRNGNSDQAARQMLVRAALRESPDLTAPQLASLLARAGEKVSVRTAQRLRAQAASSSRPSGAHTDSQLGAADPVTN